MGAQCSHTYTDQPGDSHPRCYYGFSNRATDGNRTALYANAFPIHGNCSSLNDLMKTSIHIALTLRRAHYAALSLISIIALGACAPAAPAQAALPFVLVTVAPNASPTPTPFQPSYPDALATATALIDSAATLPLPTETPSPTPVPPVEPTATVDLNQLFPTNGRTAYRGKHRR